MNGRPRAIGASDVARYARGALRLVPGDRPRGSTSLWPRVVIAAATNGDVLRLTGAGAAAWWAMWQLVTDMLTGTVSAVSDLDGVTFMRQGRDPVEVRWADVREDGPTGEPQSVLHLGQQAVESPTARTTDPAPSWAAARSLDPAKVGQQCFDALRVVARFGDTGTTAYTVATTLGRESGRVARRLTDLVQRGLVEPTGDDRLVPTGRHQRIVRATPAGLRLIERERHRDAS